MTNFFSWFPAQAKATLKLGIPIAFTQLLHFALEWTDMLMVGRVNATNLAGMSLALVFLHPITGVVYGILLAINPMAAQLKGADKHPEAGAIAIQGVWMSFILCIPLILIFTNLHFVVPYLGFPKEATPIMLDYLRVMSIALPPFLGFAALRFFCEGMGITVPGLIIGVCGVVFNAFANYLFIFGGLGLPAMGAVGAAWATVLSSLVMFFGMVLVIRSAIMPTQSGALRKLVSPDKTILLEMLKVGGPIGIGVFAEVLAFAITAGMIGQIGVNAMAAHQIAISFAALIFMFPLGFSQAISSRVGYFIGQKDPESAFNAAVAGILLCALLMMVTASIIFVAPGMIISLYTNDPGVKDVAISLLFYAAVFQVADGVQVAAIGALRGFKDTRVPMMVTMLAFWVFGFGTSYWQGVILGRGPAGFWTGMVTGLAFASVFHCLRLAWLKRQVKSGFSL